VMEKVYRTLRKAYGRQAEEAAEDVAQQLLKFILLEESSAAAVADGLQRIRQHFVDLNELRVSFPKEIAEVLPEIPHIHRKASCIARAFNGMFLKHNTMNWDFLRTLPVRDLRQKFEKLNGGDPVLGAAAVMLLSSGHAIPADADIRRTLGRLGVAEEGESIADLQAFLERAISRERGYETWALLHRLGEKVCVVGEPLCGKCPLRTFCSTGKARLAARKAAPRSPAGGAKARKTRKPSGK